jgi:dihydroneopterin aldolase
MSQVVRQAVWEAQFASQEVTDRITVRNLEVTVNAGVDAWGRPKEQRALITVDLTLSASFQSAATADSLDGSTVHYGILSKEIRSLIANNQSIGHVRTGEMSTYIHARALQTADKAPLASVDINIFYPKGSMLGDGAGFRQSIAYPGKSTSTVLYLQNVRVPCVIGINSNERKQKQPVVVNLWIECIAAERADEYTKVETIMVEVRTSPSR